VGFAESKEGQALTSKEKKVVRSMGGIAGITVGCIAGMIPMLFGVKLGSKKKAQEDTPDFKTMLSIVQKKVGADKFKEIFKQVIAKVGTALDKVFKEKALNHASAYVDKAKGIITSVGKEKALKTLYEQIRDY
jgi:geranylgeranyl pyrophosphate synthase